MRGGWFARRTRARPSCPTCGAGARWRILARQHLGASARTPIRRALADCTGGALRLDTSLQYGLQLYALRAVIRFRTAAVTRVLGH